MSIFLPSRRSVLLTRKQVFALLGYDVDALAYIAAVEGPLGDNQTLETGVRAAYNDFFVGCKADGIWSAIKASCILAGARTLSGALIPLAGTAPTNNNFVSGDYSRKTGLIGDGATKYLDSNRNNNADPQNSQHLSIYTSDTPSGTLIGAGLAETGATQIISSVQRSRSFNFDLGTAVAGFTAISRSQANQYVFRTGNTNSTRSRVSETPYNGSLHIFRRNTTSDFAFSNSRIAFYSIGESLDLALLDARVTALITAIGAAIP